MTDDPNGEDEGGEELVEQAKSARDDKLAAMLAKSRALIKPPPLPKLPPKTPPSLDELASDKEAESTDPEIGALPELQAIPGGLEADDGFATKTRPDFPALGETTPEVSVDASIDLPDLLLPLEQGLAEETAPSLAGLEPSPMVADDTLAPFVVPTMPMPVVPEPILPDGGYGMLPDLGERSRSGEHPSFAVNEDPKRVVAAAAALGLVALVAITAMVIQNWVSPTRAWLWFAGGLFAVTLLTANVVPWDPLDSSRRRWAAVRLGPAAGGILVGLLAAAVWSVPSVRALAVSRASDDVAAMRVILNDSSDLVSGTACQRYIVHFNDPGWWSSIYNAMSSRPGLVTTCLDGAPPAIAAAASQSLADRWSRDLHARDFKPSTEDACAMANGLVQLPLEVTDSSARLLDCMLSSASSEAQGCCANALSGTVTEPRQWARRLRDAASRIEGVETPRGVFAMAFHREGLTEAHKTFAEAVGFESVEGKGAALALACHSISRDPELIISHLRAALADHCPVDVVALPSEQSFWTYVCDATNLEIEADPTYPPIATLCAKVVDEATPRAVDAARRLTGLARTKPGSGLADRAHSQHSMLISNIELTDRLDSLNLTPAERAAMSAERQEGTVVILRTKEQRELLRTLDEKGRRQYYEWEKQQKSKVLDRRRERGRILRERVR